MKFLSPQSPLFSFEEWQTAGFSERARLICETWGVQGFGAPPIINLFYFLKIGFYVWMWTWFASFSTDLGGMSDIGSWWFKPEALIKAIVWSMLFEGMGLGAGSGPLTARYMPPFGGFLYFLRPGTVRIPFRPEWPVVGGDSRRWIDVIVYALHLVQLVRILVAPEVTPAILWPTVVILLTLGLLDRAAFLASRPEHFLTALVCFLFPGDAIAGSKFVWFGIWFWAATSKLNRHFPGVIAAMVSNSATVTSPAIRKRLFRNYPDDMQPSLLTKNLAHFGTVTEYTFPLVLMFGAVLGGPILFEFGTFWTIFGLVVMLSFHTFISSHFPLAVPLEWNVIMVYGGFVLFGAYADVWAFGIQSPLLIVILLFALVAIPLIGNLFPAYVSFLLGMRYYAGNWPFGVWLFKDDAEEKIGEHVTTTSPLLLKQLSLLYDRETSEMAVARVMAFRMMHLHGRALHTLVPKAIDDDFQRYAWRDGELVCGVTVGWNFGEGFLHNEHLLRALQRRCQWESGEVRCIFVNPQPFGRPHLDWRIVDAKDGEIASGRIPIDDLIGNQPFPDFEPVLS